MGDMGLQGAGGVQGFAGGLEDAYMRRLMVAKAQNDEDFRNKQLAQTDALTRLKVLEVANAATAKLAEQRSKDQEAQRQHMDLNIAKINPATDVPGNIIGGLSPIQQTQFAPKPMQALSPAPPAGIAAPDDSGLSELRPIPGTVANSPLQPNDPSRQYNRTLTQAEEEKQVADALAVRKQDAIERKPSPLGPVMETPQGLVRIGRTDNSVTPIPAGGAGGSQLQKFHAPLAPILLNIPGQVPSTVDRRSNTATPIKDGAGAPLPVRETAQTVARRDMATRIAGQIPDIEREIEEADKAGALGPLAGRTINDLLANKIGSTGDPAKDELLGHLRMDLAALSTGFASLHGRGGGNQGMAREVQTHLDSGRLSKDGLTGAVGSLKRWIGDYAKVTGGGSGAAGGTVKMKAPTGDVSDVPAAQVEHFKSLGATVVP